MNIVIGLSCLLSSIGLSSAKDAAVVFVVDPSWDCVESYVANVPLLQEYNIIKVMTRLGKPSSCNSDHADIHEIFTYDSWTPNDTLAAEEFCPKLRSIGFPIEAVIPTFDPAVALTDRLAACLGTRGNPFEGPLARTRRDKWAEGEAVRKAGIRAVKEKLVSNWGDAKAYLESLSPPLSQTDPVIFKILGGSSSEGVQKVSSLKQAEDIFSREIGSKNSFGLGIDQLLIQEFLKGQEYVIDSVSRDGVHKVVTVWTEDLRPGNGIFSLYYGFKVMHPKDRKTKAIIDYANKVLDATGVYNGASDMEVKWLEDEGTPCLVDLNARWTALMWHDGLALEKAIVGNDQITATVNAYLDGDAFDKMPAVPSVARHGAIIFTNVFHSGILTGIPGMAVATKLPSYFGSYNERAVLGKPIEVYTAGNPPITILLAHKDEAVVDADYNRIIEMECSNKFWEIAQSTGYAFLPALSSGDGDLPSQWLPAIGALAMVAVAALMAIAAVSRRNIQDGTEYLSIE